MNKRIEAFVNLGKFFRFFANDQLDAAKKVAGNSFTNKFGEAITMATENNYWFSHQDIIRSMEAIAHNMLQENILEQWLSAYSFPNTYRRVGIVMAGNIPLVGFHDLLCVLITGSGAVVKFSSKDTALMQIVCELLLSFNPEFSIEISGRKLVNIDGLIATGSNNTARYFESEYKNIPKIIRKNRFSVAILDGMESLEELELLTQDMFTYYGLGCRNVSNLFIPQAYSFDHLIEICKKRRDLMKNEGYRNSYRYRKALLKLKEIPFVDAETVIFYENSLDYSSLASVYFQKYSKLEEVSELLKIRGESIQCIVSKRNITQNSLNFGQTQSPYVSDYADNIDTIKFIIDSI